MTLNNPFEFDKGIFSPATKNDIETKIFELQIEIERIKKNGSYFEKDYKLKELEAQLDCIKSSNNTNLCLGNVVEYSTIIDKEAKETGISFNEFEGAYNKQKETDNENLKNKIIIITSIVLITAITGVLINEYA